MPLRWSFFVCAVLLPPLTSLTPLTDAHVCHLGYSIRGLVFVLLLFGQVRLTTKSFVEYVGSTNYSQGHAAIVASSVGHPAGLYRRVKTGVQRRVQSYM